MNSSFKQIALPRTLYGRIALVLWLLVSGLAVTQYFVSGWLYKHANDRLDQIFFSEIADVIAAQIEPLLSDPLDEVAIGLAMREAVRANPQVDAYLLDSKGKVVLSTVPLDVVRHLYGSVEVTLEQVRYFLDRKPNKSFPIYGSNPHQQSENEVFSAAAVSSEYFTGFVYVILNGSKYGHAVNGFQDYYAISGSLIGYLVLGLFTATIGTLIFLYVTRRFRKITSAVQHIADGNWQHRTDVAGDDELGTLAVAINHMAETTEQSLRALEEKDTLRRELVSHIAHDLRGPLTAAQGYLDSVSEGYDSFNDEQRKDGFAKALRSLTGLSDLTRDLLELSKLEVKAVTPELQSFDILELVSEEIVPRFRQSAESKGITFSAEYPEELPFVVADMRMIERVLGNLVDNAIKYNNDGGTVEIRLKPVPNAVEISIEDSGPGISAEEKEQIFASFFRSSKARKKGEGSGLGLAIVKGILEAHGRQISVETEQGKGTVFTFSVETDESD